MLWFTGLAALIGAGWAEVEAENRFGRALSILWLLGPKDDAQRQMWSERTKDGREYIAKYWSSILCRGLAIGAAMAAGAMFARAM